MKTKATQTLTGLALSLLFILSFSTATKAAAFATGFDVTTKTAFTTPDFTPTMKTAFRTTTANTQFIGTQTNFFQETFGTDATVTLNGFTGAKSLTRTAITSDCSVTKDFSNDTPFNETAA